MWFLFLYTIINAITSARGFQNLYRLKFGPAEVGILDGLMLLGVIIAAFSGPKSDSDPVDRMHPGYLFGMICMAAGFVFGTMGMFLHDASMHFKLVFLREFFGMPAAMFIGYRLTKSFKSAQRFPYAMILGGIGVSIMMMAAFGRGAERYELVKDMNALRTVNFVTNYAGVASGILIYTMLAGLRLLPLPIAMAVAGFCFIGQLTPLHRSDWVAQAAAICAIPLCLPAGARLKQSLRLVMVTLALVLSLWAGLYVASAVTGRNFHKTFEDRLMSMLPGERLKASDQKAWDTRLPGMIVELEIWMTNPISGKGFAIQEATGRGEDVGYGFHHNAYTSTLAQTGIFGFVGVCIAVLGPIVVGMQLIRHGRGQRAAMLVGALGIVAGVQQGVLGMATASFNGYRWAMMVGMISGVCFKVRDMQLTAQRLAAEYGNDPAYQGEGFPVMNDMLPIPDFDDYGRPLPGPGYN